MFLWRISNYEDLDGIGGLKNAGRWHSLGKPVVYLSEHPALALLELLAQFSIDELPAGFKILQVRAPKLVVTKPALPGFWSSDIKLTREIGDEWLRKGASALLKVPTVLVPKGWNYLLNPSHAEAKAFSISRVETFKLDPRLR